MFNEDKLMITPTPIPSVTAIPTPEPLVTTTGTPSAMVTISAPPTAASDPSGATASEYAAPAIPKRRRPQRFPEGMQSRESLGKPVVPLATLVTKDTLFVPTLDLSEIFLSFDGQALPGSIFLGKASDIEQHIQSRPFTSRNLIINAGAAAVPETIKGVTIKSEVLIFSRTATTVTQIDLTDDAKELETPPGCIKIEYRVIRTRQQLNEVYNIFMPDSSEAPIDLIFDYIADRIQHGVLHMIFTDDFNVYVACAAGISRSASLLVAYMAKQLNYPTFESAMDVLRPIRDVIYPNMHFEITLREYFRDQQARVLGADKPASIWPLTFSAMRQTRPTLDPTQTLEASRHGALILYGTHADHKLRRDWCIEAATGASETAAAKVTDSVEDTPVEATSVKCTL